MNLIQKFFNISAHHLLTQGEIGFSSNMEVAYKGYYVDNRQLQCAIGILIDDPYYDESFEGNVVSSPEILNAIKASHNIDRDFTEKEIQFLCDLQAIHDVDESQVEFWPMALRILAEEYELNSDVIDQAA